MLQLIDKLIVTHRLEPGEYRLLLEKIGGETGAGGNERGGEAATNDSFLDALTAAARKVAIENFGNGVYARGLIEISNFCRNDCLYCGIRRSNRNVARYRLSKEQIVACCRLGADLGFQSFVLQGGEDMGMSDDAIAEIVAEIRREFPRHAITLSLGERGREAFQRFFDAGADRYLLRHETADNQHYTHLHPAEMSLEKRLQALHDLREIGYQVGTGIMVGSPGQTLETLVKDIVFIEHFRPEMVGLGPFLPQHDTPFGGEKPGSLRMTLALLAIFRLMMPRALIPSTTSLATLASEGRVRGILAGANVVMPNLSPVETRALYALYDGKKSFGTEAAEGVAALTSELATIGYQPAFVRGDYRG